MFRNIRFYRVTSQWPDSEQALSELLTKNTFKPCGPFTERSSGWEAADGSATGLLGRRVNGADLLQLRTQSRLLPNAVVAEALVDRVNDFKSRMQQEPSRREVRRLKVETREELLPKSLLRSERVRGFFLLAEGMLCIDAGSESKAERFLDQLRPCLEHFEFSKVAFGRNTDELLTQLFLGDEVAGLMLGNECRMQDLSDKQAIVTWRNIDLQDGAIRQHVVDGMKLTHLALNFDATLSCLVSADCDLSKVRFPATELDDAIDDPDPLARLDAEFVLLSGTIAKLLRLLTTLLNGYKTADQPAHASAA
jgi:recombination associated protein RdgC